ncbi:MAG: hypothetical protein R6U39_08315 [Candidatus Aegiribacteria sp.]
MKRIFLFLAALCVAASCGSDPGGDTVETSRSRFVPPDDPGVEMYRSARFTPDWRLRPMNPVDWETALGIPAVGVTRDEEGRVTEAAGFWRGRRSDNVAVAEHPPLLRFAYDGNIETITFHYADGTPFSMQGIRGYSVTRDPEIETTVLTFLGEGQEPVPMDEGVWSISFEPDSGNWYSRVLRDSSGEPARGPEIFTNRYLLDDDDNPLALEMRDPGGDMVPLGGNVFRLEMSYDGSGNIIERKRLDLQGIPVVDPAYPGWQTYEISDDGLTLGYTMLGPDGDPAENRQGAHSGEFTYDRYGRILEMKSFDAEGEPVAPGGVWNTRREYDDTMLRTAVTRLDPLGEPVEVAGVARTVMFHDSLGSVTEISYWDSEGEPARDPVGVHRYTYTYGDHARRMELRIWEPTGEPGTSSRGYHIERFIYDGNGNPIAAERLDLDGEPVR